MSDKKKIFIITTPCSGKTTFVKENKGKHRDMDIIDFEDVTDKYSEKLNIPAMSKMDRIKTYNKILLPTLKEHPSSACILGPLGTEDPSKHKNITFATVIIPEEKMLSNLKARQEASKEVGPWTILENIKKYREDVLYYSKENNIPIYPSFTSALEDLNKE